MFSKIKIDRKFWINLIFFILGGILLVYLYVKYRVAPDIAADLQLKDLNGKVVKLSDYKGKAVFLNFWATWCGPCVQELPTMEAARQQLDSTKIVFITVADEDPAKISNFYQGKDFHFIWTISEKRFKELGINTYPTTYIIDKHGHIVMSRVGGVDWSDAATIASIREIIE